MAWRIGHGEAAESVEWGGHQCQSEFVPWGQDGDASNEFGERKRDEWFEKEKEENKDAGGNRSDELSV